MNLYFLFARNNSLIGIKPCTEIDWKIIQYQKYLKI